MLRIHPGIGVVVNAPRLWVKRLSLTDFRNHADAHLSTDGRPVCLFGPNGAGKTNILEALTMLAPGRGLRAASLQDMSRDGDDGEKPWTVHARLVADDEELMLGVGVERTPSESNPLGGMKRVTRMNGQA